MSRPHEPLSLIGLYRASGVHVATQKRWLRGERIRPESAAKIEAAIARLGGTIIDTKIPEGSEAMSGEPR